MESWNYSAGEKESPSEENIAHPQLKSDGESLEDFEDITKDEPSVKDLTAEFLQFETGERTKSPEKEDNSQNELQFDFDSKNDDFLISRSSNDVISKEFDNTPILKSSEVSDQGGYGETFPETEPDDLEKNCGNLVSNILDDNKLVDITSNDEISTESDNMSFIPKKGESSPKLQSGIENYVLNKPPLDCKSSDTIRFPFNSQPVSEFTSEPIISNKQEPEFLQGDGLSVRKTVEYDLSDNEDDVIPEPIPKDYPEIGALEGKHFLVAMGIDTWFHPELLHPKVESLIYWRDPKKSGIVFGVILIILLSLTSFSLISVVAYTSLIALVGALAFRIYKSVMQAVQKTSDGHPFKEYLDIDLTVNPDRAREIAEVVVTHINKTLTEVRRLFLVEDVVDSVKFGVLLWGLTYIGAWFNGLSLIIIAFVGLFTLPKVYENNKTQIDTNIDLVKSKINEYTEKITAVIPLGKKTEEVKDKGE